MNPFATRGAVSGFEEYVPTSKSDWKKVALASGIVAAVFSYLAIKGVVKRTVRNAKQLVKRTGRKIKGLVS